MRKRVLLFNPPSLETKNIVRDLLYGCWCQGKRIAGAEFPPHSLLSIYTIIKNEIPIKLLDYQSYAVTLEGFKKIIKYFDWLIIPCSFQAFHDDLRWLQVAKQVNSDIKTIIFGALSTFSPESVAADAVDYGIIGEPELHIYNLIINTPDLSADLTPGICFFNKKEKKIISYPPIYAPLDKIPIPDRAPIKDYIYFNPLTESKNWTTMLTSRGCPNACIFCTSPNFYGKKYRYNSPERMIEEVIYLKQMGYKEIFFRDETLTTNIPRVIKFCESLIERNIKIKWICNSRVNHISQNLLSLMKKAGCHTIKFGVESGNQDILNTLKKGITILQIKKAFQLCHNNGIKTHAHMIIGNPGEKLKDVKDSIDLLKEIKPTSVTFNIFTPYPGSSFFAELEKEFESNYVNQKTALELFRRKSSEFYPEILNSSETLTNRRLVKIAYRDFYLRKDFFLNIIKSIKSISDLTRLIKSGISVLGFMFGSS